MTKEYTLLIRKTSDERTYSTVDDFGFAVCDGLWPDIEAKDLASRDWPSLDGEDVYFPQNGGKLKAFDMIFDLCYKGAPGTAYQAFKDFRNWLFGITDSKIEMKIYDPFWKRGYSKVYVKKISNIKAARSNVDNVVYFKATFRITDPSDEAILNYVENQG